MNWIRTHWKIVTPVTVVVVAVVVAYLAFGVFGVHTLFVDDTVDEAAPVFASGADAADDAALDDPAASGAGVTTTIPPTTTPAESTAPPSTVGTPTDSVVTTPPSTVAPSTVPPSTVAPEPVIVTIAEGSFISRDHSGSGIATVLTDGSEQRFLRFEQFATDNGPDLNVYLTTNDANGPEGAFDDPGEFVDLGDLTGNIGDQNYEIPPDVDLERFDTVVVWCVRFSSAFTAADLLPT